MTRDELIKLQQEDEALKKLTGGWEARKREGNVARYKISRGILYRLFDESECSAKKSTRQVVLPTGLREHVMKVAHESLLAGHVGAKKTAERILSSFYWPGLGADVQRFCHSYDVCQRTVSKGSVGKAPLGKMPLIDRPFQSGPGPDRPAKMDMDTS